MKRALCCVVLASACTGEPGESTGSTAEPPETGTASSGEAATGATGAVDSTGPVTGGATTTDDPSTSGTATTSEVDDTSAGSSSGPGPMCSVAMTPCNDIAECCDGLQCDDTSLGQVCCGLEGTPCATENGQDCCGNLLCVDGACGYNLGDACESPCTPAPALTLEKQRLANIGGSFLGICGDANHTYGFHVPAAKLPDDDYSLEGDANDPVCQWHAAAIDIGMDWPASRDWLKWLIEQRSSGGMQGVAEVIGSYDGENVRYWSNKAGWTIEGIPYEGQGHDTWTHVSIFRSLTLQDHGILKGWTADGML